MGALDIAITEKRKEAAEMRKAHWRAREAIRMKPARQWTKKVPIEARGGHRHLLAHLVTLCAKVKTNGGTRWYCEPRVKSLASHLGITDRAIKKQLAALEKEGLILRFDLPHRKRTRGQSTRCCYLAVAGEHITRDLAKKEGFEQPKPKEIIEPEGELEGELSSPLFRDILRISMSNNPTPSPIGETARGPVEATKSPPKPVPVEPYEPVLREYQPLEPVHNPDLRAKLNDLYAQIAEIEDRLSENTEPRRDFYVIEGGASG